MSDICFLASFAYEQGEDPIDYAAENVIQAYVDAWLTIREARTWNPAAFPGYLLDLSTPALARQILGNLMDAGWTPPEVKR